MHFQVNSAVQFEEILQSYIDAVNREPEEVDIIVFYFSGYENGNDNGKDNDNDNDNGKDNGNGNYNDDDNGVESVSGTVWWGSRKDW